VVTTRTLDKASDEFDDLNTEFKAAIGKCADYNERRFEQKLSPIGFRLVNAEAIVNPLLVGRFERERQQLRDAGRSAEELRVKVGFHGTRESNVPKIARSGLLRIGHPLNPSKSTDKGWFGSPQHAVYLSQNVDYALKYSNDLAPLLPGDSVKVLMFRVCNGKGLHIAKTAPGMMPTAGYDSHSSANFLEWYLFRESLCVPTHVLTVRVFEDRRTDSDDKQFKG
jgi:hypothetical protein